MAHDTPAARPQELNVSRVFSAPRERVFAAWSSAEHVKQWFCPEMLTVPEAHVDFRVGGVFEVCMRMPDGTDHWSRGHFIEIIPNARLVIEMGVSGQDGALLFSAHTAVTFEDEGKGTRMSVTQNYTVLQPIAEQMIKGARQGWSETLDRLGRTLA